MAECYSVHTGALAIAATTTKTFASIITSATATGRLIQASVSFDGTGSLTPPAIEIVRFTTDGTGTAYTPLRFNGEGQARAAVATAKTNYTAEPGTPTVVESYFVPNTSGMFWQYPLGRELYLPPSTVTGLRIVTASGVTGNVRVNLAFEE